MPKKSFLLRIDEKILEEVRRMADDELRSMNGQIEYLLRAVLKERGRLPEKAEVPEPDTSDSSD
jgi:hypothetical protein